MAFTCYFYIFTLHDLVEVEVWQLALKSFPTTASCRFKGAPTLPSKGMEGTYLMISAWFYFAMNEYYLPLPL